MEHYTLQSQAIQNAFADLNTDVTNGVITCPVTSCPFQPIIVASAFAQVWSNPLRVHVSHGCRVQMQAALRQL